ncbi:MAG: M20/M25/M40 family metallo-hydrolase [Sphaerochaetaceae bacterium]|jgi:carboxypeptidase PM20D1|nr:M20/M25/M40 family metallo-hydrolase [Sphaerochaetaceae bacterium]
MVYEEKLGSLIRIQTVSQQDEAYAENFNFFEIALTELFPAFFKATEDIGLEKVFLRVWQGLDKTLDPLVLMSHQDVVEASGNWTYPPFSGMIKDGYVWGRGALDNKGTLFSILEASDQLASQGFQPERTIYFLSGKNEEIGGEDARRAREWFISHSIHIYMTLDEGGAIIDDPLPGAHGRFAMIGLGEKSFANVRFIASGPGGHASTPSRHSPIAQLCSFVVECDRKKIFTASMNKVVKSMLKSLAPSMKGLKRIVFSSIGLTGPLVKAVMLKASPAASAMLRTTMAFTTAQGSSRANVIPQQAWVGANLRFSHHQGSRKSLEAVSAIAHKHGLEVKIDSQGIDSPIGDPDSKGFRIVEDACRKALGIKAVPYIQTGASDSRWLAGISDYTFRFAPLDMSEGLLKSVHGIDERVPISSLAKAVDFFKTIIGLVAESQMSK